MQDAHGLNFSSSRSRRFGAGPSGARRSLRRVSIAAIIASSVGTGWALHSQRESNASTAPTPRYEVATIADTNYAIPSGALFVSNTGNDSNVGTQSSPLLTISRALSVAPTGATVVVRGGTYREQLGLVRHTVTIQAFPHEQVWVKGSLIATSFTAAGGLFSKPWTSTICDTCFPAGVLDPSYPAAGLPEQVFVDGAPVMQVTTRAAVTPGTFFMDRSANQLYLGTNPAGHTVEVTAYDAAATFSTQAPGSAVKGIGFAHYASHYNTDTPAMVTSTSDNMVFDHDTFAWSAGRGLAIYATNQTVQNSLFVDNGLSGFHSYRTTGTTFQNNRISFSNFEQYSIVPSAIASIAAAKITYGTQGVYRNNIFSDNYANGLWFDVSASHNVAVNNTSARNSGHGISVEISGFTTVAGNVIVANGRDGLKISGANDVDVYNNTIVANGWAQLGVYEDPRRATSPVILGLGVTWDTTNVRIHNNVLIAFVYSNSPVLFSFDLTSPHHLSTSNMIASEDNNIFGRADMTSALRYMASVQATLNATARYTDLAALQAATNRDRSSQSADNIALSTLFTNPGGADWSLTRSAPMPSIATLPSAVAVAMGVATNPGKVGAINAPLG